MKNKTSQNKFTNTILKFYTPLAVVLIIGIVGSFYLSFSKALYVGISGNTIQHQASKIYNTRKDYGRTQLFFSKCLSDVGNSWSKKMATTRVLDHNDNVRAEVEARCGSDWTLVGENVGYGPTSEAIFAEFMKSPPHKANILYTSWDNFGVGAYRDSRGVLWVTQVYAQCPGSCGGAFTTHASFPLTN